MIIPGAVGDARFHQGKPLAGRSFWKCPALLPVVVALFMVTACRAQQFPPSTPPPDNTATPLSSSFSVTQDEIRQRNGQEELIEKLASEPYAYFRFISRPFAQRVCELFRDLRWGIPATMVHGDAHLEQFVITDETYGLEDFDHSGLGSPVVDLVRFAASIHLACLEVEWACNPEAAVSVFLSAYRDGVQDPPPQTSPPPVVTRLRSEHRERPDFLEWAESLMVPPSPEQDRAIRNAWERLVMVLREVEPREPEFFEIVKMGELTLGIGSALDRKYLFRVRGPTDDPNDDIILEAKPQQALEGVECVLGPPVGGMLRPIAAAARIGRRVPDVFGYVPLEDGSGGPPLFWIQEWDAGYAELSIHDLRNQTELDQIARDAGLQLGMAAPSLVPPVLLEQHQHACLRVLDSIEGRIREAARALSAEVLVEWNAYRQDH